MKYGRKQQGHGGQYANDPIDDCKVNLRYEKVEKPNSTVYEDYVHVYITEPAWETIANLDELFIAYGKDYWLYRPFWDDLSEVDQREAAKLYDIDVDTELLDA